jgi:hypothetical protein
MNGGWDDFEQEPSDSRDVTQKRVDTDRLFLRVLGTDDGKELMVMLRQWYVEPPVATPGAPADHAFYREGQRNVIQDIEARIRRALNG